MPKATREQARQRTELITKIRLLGAGCADIAQFCEEEDVETGRPWHLSRRQIWRYIAASDRMIAQDVDRNRDRLFAKHLAMRRTLYARACEAGDVRAALAVVDSEARLLGLFPEKAANGEGSKTQINIWAPALQRLTDDELHTMARLAEKLNGESTNGFDNEADASAAGTGIP